MAHSKGMKARVPHWPLDRVKGLVAEGKVWIQVTRAVAFFESREDAFDAVEQVFETLTARAFAHSTAQTQDVCDVYGVARREDAGWYLKICIDETVPEVAVVSFHPLERPLRTNGGEVRPKGWAPPGPRGRQGR